MLLFFEVRKVRFLREEVPSEHKNLCTFTRNEIRISYKWMQKNEQIDNYDFDISSSKALNNFDLKIADSDFLFHPSSHFS